MYEDYYNGALGFRNTINLNQYVFETALSQWTERQQLGNGYSKRMVQFYDALIWTRVENAKQQYKMLKSSLQSAKKRESEPDNAESGFSFKLQTSIDAQNNLDEFMESVNTWKYTGKVYRVIGCKPDKVEYHDMIASWTNNPLAFADFNHLICTVKYTFLIGHTGKNWAFDVNKYRRIIGDMHQFTEYESEIILPMNKKYVKDVFYGTLDGFYKYINIDTVRY